MVSPKPITLRVRASKTAHLCFETGGILGELNTELGAPVDAFDFPGFYAILGSMPTVPGHPARLIYDFLEIQAATNAKGPPLPGAPLGVPFALASLRAETTKTALNKAINSRANAFYAKYANAPAVIAQMISSYSPSVTQSKPNQLDILASLSEQQMLKLSAAYSADGKKDVVKHTISELCSQSDTDGTSDGKDVQFLTTTPQTFTALPSGAPAVTVTGTDGAQETMQMVADKQHTSTDTHIRNTDYGYRVPYLENFAQYHRAQISLIDERFAQFMSGQNLPYLAAVFQNELNMIDSDVFRLQIAYMNTILLSPFDGKVTGIYKNQGDSVRAAEPVIRVEDDSSVFLLATLVYRGPIGTGATLNVTTQLYDASGPTVSVTGPIVSVRGQSEDDRWEIIAKCNNVDGSGNRIFPLGYHFDFDDTTVSIT